MPTLKTLFPLGLIITFLLSSFLGCEDDKPVCGNGIVEKGEECDDGNLINNDACTNYCLLPAYKGSTIVVRWFINGTQTFSDAEYSFDTCSDVDASKTLVKIYGPAGLVKEAKVSCSAQEYRYTDTRDNQLQDGSYYAEVTFYDSNDATISETSTSQPAQLIRRDETILLTNNSLDSFTNGPFTGVFYFELSWNHGTCEDEGISTMEMNLTLDGSEVASMQGACIAARHSFTQEVPTSDNYVLSVKGYTQDGTLIRCYSMQDIKIGAGVTNPIVKVDVPSDATVCE